MAVFKELLPRNTLEDPEARVAEDLRRGSGKFGKTKRERSASVGYGHYSIALRIVTIVGLLAIALGVAALIYMGVGLFMTP